MCIGAGKSVSASIALCNMIGLMEHFSSSVAKEVSRKVLFSTSATIAMVIKKKEFHALQRGEDFGGERNF